jgi:uncharacterized protein YjbI with pentapeptide repeats
MAEQKFFSASIRPIFGWLLLILVVSFPLRFIYHEYSERQVLAVQERDISKRITAENSNLTTAAQVCGGLFLFIGLGFTAWNSWTTQKNMQIAQRNMQIAEDGKITDRFSKAVELLASDKLSMRLGGIYALERIAKDSDRDSDDQVMEILMAFVRAKRCRQVDKEIDSDIQAILNILKLRNCLGIDLSGAHLSGAYLIEADLPLAYFSQANLSGAHLNLTKFNTRNINGIILGANFSGANLSGAELFGAYLSFADLSKADLRKADLLDANLIQANLSGADLREANLTRTKLIGTKLVGAKLVGVDLSETELGLTDFSGAHLNETKLNENNLNGVNLSEADLSKADLSGTYLIKANLSGAKLIGVDLRGTHLTGANMGKVDFADVKNLTLEQLVNVETLYQCKNLDSTLLDKIRLSHPELLEESKDG